MCESNNYSSGEIAIYFSRTGNGSSSSPPTYVSESEFYVQTLDVVQTLNSGYICQTFISSIQ